MSAEAVSRHMPPVVTLDDWVVDRDTAQTVTLLRLGDGSYEERAKLPLAWLLHMAPADHLG